MIDLSGLSKGSSGGSGGGGGSIPAGAFVTPQYYSQNFGLLYKQVTTDGTTGTVTTAFELAAPNMIPTEGTETDPTTGNVVVTSLIGPQVMNALVIGNIMLTYDETNNAIKVVNRDGSTAANFYATGGVSALGYSPGGGGGGGADLNALLDNINSSNIGNIAPTANEVGKCLVYNGNNQWAWATPGGGGGTGTVTLTGDVTGTGTGTVATTIGTGRVTNSMLAGDIANDKLLHDTITIAGVDVALGGAITAANLLSGLQSSLNGQYVTIGTTQNITATKTFTAYQNMRGINLDTQGDIRQELPNNGGTFYLGYNAGGGSTGFNLAYSPDAVNVSQLVSVLTNGNVGIGNNSPSYKMDVSGNIHTTTAYYLNGKLFANNNSGLHIGYSFADADLPTTIWGDGISFRSVDGTYGECTTIDNTYGLMGTDFIGVTNKFRFEYDSTNNTVWVLKADGTPVNFASLGGVSALGAGSNGTPSLNTLTVASLRVSGTATINTLSVTNEIETLDVNTLHITNELWIDGNNINMDGGNIEDAYQVQTTQMIVGSGGSTIKKIYWDGTYLQVQIGTTTYKFRPDATA